MHYQESHSPIKAWAEEDRPREKLLLKGYQALSDAELLAILIGTGSRSYSALSLAQMLLAHFENSLHNLSESSIANLQKIKGIGQAKAVSIAAAMELGRRRLRGSRLKKPQITSSKDAYQVLAPKLMDLPHEEFWILLLNRANKVLKAERISTGGLTGTVVDVRLIFQKALCTERTAAIILAHNHPSGQLKPSDADKVITRKLKEAGKIVDIPVLDHLIIAGDEYLSFADEALL